MKILFNEFNENNNSDNIFEKKKEKLIKLLNDVIKEYDNFTYLISKYDYRASGRIFFNLKNTIEEIKSMSEGKYSEFEYNTTYDKNFEKKFKELYPEKYEKYMRYKNMNKFNI